MKRCRLLPITLLVALAAAAPVLAQSAGRDALAADLSKEESLLSTGLGVSPEEVARIAKLDEEINAAGFKDLATRADIALAIARDREQSKSAAEALSVDIRNQVALMRRQDGQHIRDGIAEAGFWTGVSGAGVAILSGTMSNWAFNEFYNANLASTAQNYFLTGKVANIVLDSAIATAILGFGVAGIDLFGLYNAPTSPAGPFAVEYPSDTLTQTEKVAYLQKRLADYSNAYARASRARSIGTTSFVAGLLALTVTGTLALAANNTFALYNNANFNTDATSLRTQLSILQWAEVGTGTLAAAGFGGAIASFFLFPDPEQVLSASANVQSQLRAVEGERR